MPKRISEQQKEEIIQSFQEGKTIEFLSKKFNFNKLTIVRNLKKILGEAKYKKFLEIQKAPNVNLKSSDIKIRKDCEIDSERLNPQQIFSKVIKENQIEAKSQTEISSVSPFFEIAPLDCEIDNTVQKDFSSVPISEINFPKTAYMIVDRKIELEIKLLKDYPEWQFLSDDELNRKTIEMYDDLKTAKSRCNKEQKVIKVPNTNVFKLVVPFLLSRGISRIVTNDNLIAL